VDAVRRLRPSPALVIALLALFVALGGPAQAARLLTGKDIKNRSLSTKDLSKKAVKTLRSTPRGSVKEGQLANGAVSSGKLRDAAVTTGKIAPSSIDSVRMAPNAIGPRELMSGGVVTASLAESSVTGSKVADGSLDSRDIARFSGRFKVAKNDVPQIQPHTCWSGQPRALAPELAGADISQDLVIVTPDSAWPQDQLAFTTKNSASSNSLFVLAACNVTDTAVDWPQDGVGFRYAVIDLP
jgi:hypothetical protein